MRKTLYLLALVFLLGCATPAPSPVVKDSHSYSVKNMIATIGLDSMLRNQANINLEKVKKDKPSQAHIVDCAMRKMDKGFYLELMTPVFKRYYSKEDAEKLTELFTKPVGKKLKTYLLAHLDPNKELPHFNKSDAKQIAKYQHLLDLLKESINDLKDVAKKEATKVAEDCARSQ